MVTIDRIDALHHLKQYSDHLKNLTQEDRISRFGYNANNHSIDGVILNMCYHPGEHELWIAEDGDSIVGWGHMALNDDDSWELAVSVEHEHQRRGIGNQLIVEMLTWAKFHKIKEVYMNCIESNKVIQHLAAKNELKTRSRCSGERVAAIEVPEPTILEANQHLWREQADILKEIGRLQLKLSTLWTNPQHR